MKKFSLLFLVIILFSCSTTKIVSIDPVTKLKLFENEEVSFQYPTNWESLNKPIWENSIITIAPKKLVKTVYTLQNQSHLKRASYSKVNILLFQIQLEKNQSFSDFLADLVKKAQKRNQVYLDKITSDHFVLTTNTRENNVKIRQTSTLGHYFLRQNTVLLIKYYANSNYYQHYLTDFTTVIASLHFKSSKKLEAPLQTP